MGSRRGTAPEARSAREDWVSLPANIAVRYTQSCSEARIGRTDPSRNGLRATTPALRPSHIGDTAPRRAARRKGPRESTHRLAGEARIGGYGGQGGWGAGAPHARGLPPGGLQNPGSRAKLGEQARPSSSAAARPLSRRRRGHCGASNSIRGRGHRVVAAPPHTVTLQGCGYPNKSGS